MNIPNSVRLVFRDDLEDDDRPDPKASVLAVMLLDFSMPLGRLDDASRAYLVRRGATQCLVAYLYADPIPPVVIGERAERVWMLAALTAQSHRRLIATIQEVLDSECGLRTDTWYYIELVESGKGQSQ